MCVYVCVYVCMCVMMIKLTLYYTIFTITYQYKSHYLYSNGCECFVCSSNDTGDETRRKEIIPHLISYRVNCNNSSGSGSISGSIGSGVGSDIDIRLRSLSSLLDSIECFIPIKEEYDLFPR